MGEIAAKINYSDISRWCKLIRFYNKRKNSEQIENNLLKIERELDNGARKRCKCQTS